VKRFVLAALVLALGGAAAVAPTGRSGGAANCGGTSVGLTPLTDLLGGEYHGYAGGLYPGRRNTPSPAYLKQGLAAAKLVRPRSAAGKPSAAGRIVLLSIGMSNATMEFSGFERAAEADGRKSSRVTIVDGAQGGQDAELVKNAAARYWQVVGERLAASGVTARQVQVVWLKEAIARPGGGFPAATKQLQADLRAIVAILRARYPNLRLVYLSSRTYAGYATTPLNPEPYAYESGLAVRWLIAEHVGRKASRPWVAWGPYLWTDGTRGRADGLVWTCGDVRQNDGTHPSSSGVAKVAGLLQRFFETSATAKSWFLARS
jgi:hypothetical protein